MDKITKELELVLVTWKTVRSTFHQFAAEYVDRELENLVEAVRLGEPYAHPDDPQESVYPKAPTDYKRWYVDDSVRDLPVED